MKAKNFKNGTEVRIKPNAVEGGVPQSGVGTSGTLSGVWENSNGEVMGGVNSWVVQPKHVSLVKPPADEITPGIYADGDGDLWIAIGEPLIVTCIVHGCDVADGRIPEV